MFFSLDYLEAPIEYPYIIVGVINFVTSLVLWLFHFLDKPKIKHITDDQCGNYYSSYSTQ